MSHYKGLTDYLKYITENYRLDIVFNDFIGFLTIDKQLFESMRPYMIHKNPFCMKIKSNRELWDKCIMMKRGILLKSEKLKDTYYGTCYCGVGEYIVPIFCDNVLLGVICAGEFCSDPKLSHYRIKKVAKAYNFDPDELIPTFDDSMRRDVLEIEAIKTHLGIVAEYFSNLYAKLISTHQALDIKHAKGSSCEAYILSHSIEYIKQNYTEKITVEHLSGFCHCSESYINHIFKKNMKLNVKAYINKIRIEHAKSLLVNSDESIAAIALKTGFSDPNYFSSVFSKIIGYYPYEFRRRFRSV